MMKIYIATHKMYNFPNIMTYEPIYLGKALSQENINMLGDDIGDSISELNPYFCELTALYWMWKNSNAEIVGLVHYRRYFKGSDKDFIRMMNSDIATEKSFDFTKYDIVIPSPRNYWVITNRKHYNKSHHSHDLDLIEEIIYRCHPEYVSSFNYVMSSSKLSLCNMFIAKKSIIDEYCSWLFPILFELEKLINYKKYNPYQQRVFGFLSERLFNIWLYHNRNRVRIHYRKIIYLEGEKYIQKIFNLIWRVLSN